MSRFGFKDQRFTYRPTKLRAMHYAVEDKATGQPLGVVYRDTGTTWAAADNDGRRTCDHFPGGRDTAAASLQRQAERAGQQSTDRVELRGIIEDGGLSRNDADHIAGMIVAAGFSKQRTTDGE